MSDAANSPDFARLPEGEVREDEKYLHRFFQQKKPKRSKKDVVGDAFPDEASGEWGVGDISMLFTRAMQ